MADARVQFKSDFPITWITLPKDKIKIVVFQHDDNLVITCAIEMEMRPIDTLKDIKNNLDLQKPKGWPLPPRRKYFFKKYQGEAEDDGQEATPLREEKPLKQLGIKDGDMLQVVKKNPTSYKLKIALGKVASISLDVLKSSPVSSLRNKLAMSRIAAILPQGYLFVHLTRVLIENVSFEANMLRDGDTIIISHGSLLRTDEEEFTAFDD